MKPILYMMCGPSGCGKSTFANEFLQKLRNDGIDIRMAVSRDAIRFGMLKEGEDYFAHEDEVYALFVKTLATQMQNGVSVIADATHLNIFSRRKLTHAIDQYLTDYQIVYVYFDVDVDTCLKRNSNRTGQANVPETVIRKMCANARMPRQDEDPRQIGMIIVKGDVI